VHSDLPKLPIFQRVLGPVCALLQNESHRFERIRTEYHCRPDGVHFYRSLVQLALKIEGEIKREKGVEIEREREREKDIERERKGEIK
jgi:hypothetical protein